MPDDEPAITALVAYALDLLAEGERQHRAVVRAHALLANYMAETEYATATPLRRRECLAAFEFGVAELLTVVGTQTEILTEMREAVSRLQGKLT
jgi:hypothetical protein